MLAKNIIFFLKDAKAMSYFRAISQKDERSERALELTGIIIEYNPAHYTIWLVTSKTRFLNKCFIWSIQSQFLL